MLALIPDLTPAPAALGCVFYLTNQSCMGLPIRYHVNIGVLAGRHNWRDLMTAAYASVRLGRVWVVGSVLWRKVGSASVGSGA